MNQGLAENYLRWYGMHPESIDPQRDAEKMTLLFQKGLEQEGNIVPMIPTYLSNQGELRSGSPVAVIDAGGTNFRSALVSFEDGAVRVEHLQKRPMPGIVKSATWEEFIRFAADAVEPMMNQTDRIGFCFSYTAVITPDLDGRVVKIDKEVSITGSENRLVGGSLREELERRGFHNKKVAVLNDTAAVLLGGSALVDRSRYSGFIGQVSGTGTNTCCQLPCSRISKLQPARAGSMIINMESGMADCLPQGKFDEALDRASGNPGSKYFEKLTAGVYLGELVRRMALDAAQWGLVSSGVKTCVESMPRMDSAVVDDWAAEIYSPEAVLTDDDRCFLTGISRAMLERSARCMCAVLSGIARLMDAGRDREHPIYLCAEGSLVQKSRFYRPELCRLLREVTGDCMGRWIELHPGSDTTLSGSAAAALWNL